MLNVTDLSAVNASLNAIAMGWLVTGYLMIRRKRITQHRACMVAAGVTSILFLTSYVVYHANVGSRPFSGTGVIRVAYFGVLISHIVLAAAVLPLALVTMSRGLRGRYERHVAVARWTLPIWLYVSVTGVVVYVMLYWLSA